MERHLYLNRAVVELLADIRLFCDANGLDYHHRDRISRSLVIDREEVKTHPIDEGR
jgi:hypothetical protein